MTLIAVHGHRGCRGLLPENTIEAFEKAIKLGVDAIEMDLAISKDHKVVVSHEPFMSRRICLDQNGHVIPKKDDMYYNLYAMNYDEIKLFDCGLKAHPDYPDQKNIKAYKPLLDEVIFKAIDLNPNIRFNLEIKAKSKYDGIYTPNPETFVRLVIDVIESCNVSNQTNLQSFDLRILKQIKKQAPNMQIALLVDRDQKVYHKLNKIEFKPEIISPYFKLISKDLVKDLQSKAFRVIPWTVNDISDLNKMLAFQVDGIITDYPNRLIDILNKN